MSDKAADILKAAEKLFADGRYHEVTLDEICKNAHVGKGTVYRYFHDKEDLFWQVIMSGLNELVESVQQVAEQEQDPGQGLRQVACCIARFFSQRAALFGLMGSERLRASTRKKKIWKQWHKKDKKIRAVAADFIAKGMEEGRYASSLSAAGAALLFRGMIRTGLRNRRDMPRGNDWPLALVELFEKGILVRNAPKSK